MIIKICLVVDGVMANLMNDMGLNSWSISEFTEISCVEREFEFSELFSVPTKMSFVSYWKTCVCHKSCLLNSTC